MYEAAVVMSMGWVRKVACSRVWWQRARTSRHISSKSKRSLIYEVLAVNPTYYAQILPALLRALLDFGITTTKCKEKARAGKYASPASGHASRKVEAASAVVGSLKKRGQYHRTRTRRSLKTRGRCRRSASASVASASGAQPALCPSTMTSTSCPPR